ncbi:asparagine synthetase AsnA [Neobacillus bataviensis LMG 21833]|uniref:Asparagine synthetase AsnA n=1 Tax=Neobacillus bataviensis LMG 21833 TaxID=1117379 RepID=K6DC65_9BACI|nr:asparagine synthetase AsnA [Neobacillus bataviensis]EKN70117.1 asparagine synthetase AsnA [Neobacillus bataviensis LMG 21833]
MTKSFIIPQVYQSGLNIIQTEKAIKQIKDFFEKSLADALNLIRVSAPILLKSGSGINDNLNGVERIVSFHARDVQHSKWK